ncbi:hypothetical protein SFRURICE_018261 [Spodoptera frugiperda]|nr:hypothetical protein SFRURICE_018261 [Spodoptera frugiperda]
MYLDFRKHQGVCQTTRRYLKVKGKVHRPASYASHAFLMIQYASHIGIADDAVRTMRISGRSCMSFYTRQTKICCVGSVRCRPVDAYHYTEVLRKSFQYLLSIENWSFTDKKTKKQKTINTLRLLSTAAYAEIVGESEKIIHEGSMLRLVCVVKRSTEPPSYVFWYFENRMINYDLNGVSVHNGRQTSELVIGKAEPRHAGNYTCVPANAKAASVTVHVVQSETPAAMQHGNNSSASNSQTHLLTHLLVALIGLRMIFLQNHQEFG